MSQLSIPGNSRKLLYGMLVLTFIISGFTYFQENNSAEIISAMPVRPHKMNKKKSSSQRGQQLTSMNNSLVYKRSFYDPAIDIFSVFIPTQEPPSEPSHTQTIADHKIQTVELSPAAIMQTAPPPEPTAPPVPFKYIGKLYGDDEYIVFLHLNGRNISAKTGDTIAQSYKIEEINPPLMTATYLPLNIKQTIDIGAP